MDANVKPKSKYEIELRNRTTKPNPKIEIEQRNAVQYNAIVMSHDVT